MKEDFDNILNVETNIPVKKLALIKYSISLLASRSRLPIDALCAVKAMKALHKLAEEFNLDIGKEELKLVVKRNTRFVFTAVKLNDEDNTKCDETCLFLQQYDSKCRLFEDTVNEFKRCEKCIKTFDGKSKEFIYQDMDRLSE